MLTSQWLVHGLLAFATFAFCRELRYEPNSKYEQFLGPAALEVDKSALYSLHRNLVNIQSVSGNEHEVGAFLESYLKDHNHTVERQYVKSEPAASWHPLSKKDDRRFNILAYPGSKRSTRILLSSHIDTVPPFYGYELREHDQIWGRGSVDAKACVAAQIQALHELLSAKDLSPEDASLLFVVGEETGGDGMIAVNKLDMEWETVIFGEPTELKLASGHKGILILAVTAHGKAGHSGYP